MTKVVQKSTSSTQSSLLFILVALFFGIVGVLVGLGGSLLVSQSSSEPPLPTLASLSVVVAPTATQTPIPIQRFPVSPEDDPGVGPANADVTVIVFSDFTCTFCRLFARTTLTALMQTYSDTVQFVYRDYPITNPLSTLSAQAAECVADQGQFWTYHDRLFAEQAQLTEALLETIAQDLGINMSQFDDCMADESYQAEVLADYQAGKELGLSGAPAIFINGIRLQGAHPYDEIAKIIEQELE